MDKDGTLIYFTKDWITVVRDFLLHFTEEQKVEKILTEMGYVEGNLIENGLLSSASSQEIAVFIASHLGCNPDWVLKSFRHFQLISLQAGKVAIEPVPELKKTLALLKKQKFILGIATADDFESTRFTIETLQISPYIDFIGTSDRYPAKPNREMLLSFCEKFQLKPEEVVHVGDTSIDMEFASSLLAGIGVLSGNSTEEQLKCYTSYIIESIKDLHTILPTLSQS